MRSELTLAVLVGISSWSCTKNPFGNEATIADRSTVKGTVKLDDGENSEGIYVWLEGIDIGTWTDESGKFSLSLPATGNSIGQNGKFSVYAYAADYGLDSIAVTVTDGQFVAGEEGLDGAGRLRRELILKRRLLISTSVKPLIFESEDSGVATVTVKLNPLGRTVTVKSRKAVVDRTTVYTGLLVVSTEGNVVHIEDMNIARLGQELIGTDAETWTISLNLTGSGVPPGEYTVVPYILIESDLPHGLLESMGTDLMKLSEDYLRLPMRRKDGRLTLAGG